MTQRGLVIASVLPREDAGHTAVNPGGAGCCRARRSSFGMRLELSPKPGAAMGPIERGAVTVAMQLLAMQSIGRQRRPQYRSIDRERGRGRASGWLVDCGLRNVESWRMTRNGQAGCGGEDKPCFLFSH